MNNSRGSGVAIIDYFEYFRAVNRPSRPHYHGYMNKEEYKQANIDFLRAKAAEEGVVKLQGGVLVEVLSSGVGTKCPVLGSVVMTRYRGTLIDGREFDRLTALRQLGYASTNCIVLEGMSIREEADYFRRQNENKQSLRIADTFNASVWAEDEESLQIKRLMDKYSFRHGKSGQPMCICAVGALQQIVRQLGVEALDRTLACIAATWPKDTTILRREMLAGLGEFWKRYASVLTVAQFEARMRLKLPMDLYQEVRRRTQGKATPGTAFSKSIRFVTCAVLVDAYNKGLRTGSKHRLKLEWDMAED